MWVPKGGIKRDRHWTTLIRTDEVPLDFLIGHNFDFFQFLEGGNCFSLGKAVSRHTPRRPRRKKRENNTKRRVIRLENRIPIIVEVKGEKTRLIPFRFIIVFHFFALLSHTRTRTPLVRPSRGPALYMTTLYMSQLDCYWGGIKVAPWPDGVAGRTPV